MLYFMYCAMALVVAGMRVGSDGKAYFMRRGVCCLPAWASLAAAGRRRCCCGCGALAAQVLLAPPAAHPLAAEQLDARAKPDRRTHPRQGGTHASRSAALLAAAASSFVRGGLIAYTHTIAPRQTLVTHRAWRRLRCQGLLLPAVTRRGSGNPSKKRAREEQLLQCLRDRQVRDTSISSSTRSLASPSTPHHTQRTTYRAILHSSADTRSASNPWTHRLLLLLPPRVPLRSHSVGNSPHRTIATMSCSAGYQRSSSKIAARRPSLLM